MHRRLSHYCCLVINAVDETETGTQASDDDTSAAESKISRRPHPAFRFEVFINYAHL